MDKKTALKLYESKFWEEMTYEERAKFQLFEDRLCMPFSVFHKAMEEVLKRPVWTHEFAYREMLIKEMLRERPKPSLDEIIGLIPEDKRVIVLVNEQEGGDRHD